MQQSFIRFCRKEGTVALFRFFILRGWVFYFCLGVARDVAAQTDFATGLPIFYKIEKAGEGRPVGWMLGGQHGLCFAEESFPLEIRKALAQSEIALMEIKASSLEGAKGRSVYQEAHRNILRLPEGQTLTRYIEEQTALDIYGFIQDFLREWDKSNILSEALRRAFIWDTSSFDDFNRLSPQTVLTILKILPALFEIEDERGKIRFIEQEAFYFVPPSDETYLFEPEAPNMTCHTGQASIDAWLERRFVCSGRPAHSLESFENQVERHHNNANYHSMTGLILTQLFNDIWRPRRPESETDVFLKEWLHLLEEISHILQEKALTGTLYGLGISTPPSARLLLSGFLSKNHCAKTSLLQALMIVLDSFHHIAVNTFFSGNPLSVEQEGILYRLLWQRDELSRWIFSSCFPDHVSSEDWEDQEERARFIELYKLKSMIEGTRSRSGLISQAALPFLYEGRGTFILIGAAHLMKVARDLDEHGFQVHPVALSHPLRPVSCAK